MGKSTLAARLRERGVPVFDADAAVHKLYAGAAAPVVEAAFPGTTSDGAVDRMRLSEALAADPSGFKRLEAIVHPLVRQEQRAFLRAAQAAGAPLAVLEIPLLFESGSDARVDTIILASAPPDVQRERVLVRAGMTVQKLELLLSRQVPDAEKRAKSEFVVDTSLPLTETLKQLDAIVDGLTGRKGSALETHWS
jgi:dephospho-CoA kinase